MPSSPSVPAPPANYTLFIDESGTFDQTSRKQWVVSSVLCRGTRTQACKELEGASNRSIDRFRRQAYESGKYDKTSNEFGDAAPSVRALYETAAVNEVASPLEGLRRLRLVSSY